MNRGLSVVKDVLFFSPQHGQLGRSLMVKKVWTTKMNTIRNLKVSLRNYV